MTKSGFGVTRLQDRTLLAKVPGKDILLLRAAWRYVINTERPMRNFYSKAFHSAATRYATTFRALFTAIRYANAQRFCPTKTGLYAFLQCKMPKIKSKLITNLDVLFKHMQRFLFYSGEKQKMFAAQAQSGQRNYISANNVFPSQIPESKARWGCIESSTGRYAISPHPIQVSAIVQTRVRAWRTSQRASEIVILSTGEEQIIPVPVKRRLREQFMKQSALAFSKSAQNEPGSTADSIVPVVCSRQRRRKWVVLTSDKSFSFRTQSASATSRCLFRLRFQSPGKFFKGILRCMHATTWISNQKLWLERDARCIHLSSSHTRLCKVSRTRLTDGGEYVAHSERVLNLF